MIPQELLDQLVAADFPFSTTTGLSELIAACGDEFDCLRLVHVHKAQDNYWFAEADSKIMGGIGCNGATPEEAVAHLYLVLNPKKV